MLGRIFAVIVTFSFIYGAVNGTMGAVSDAALSSSAEAVKLSMSLLGSMCLWSGTARVLDKGGFTKILGKAVNPILKMLYPESSKRNSGINECAANLCANVLGLGSAALPTGIEAMKKLSCDGSGGYCANDEAVLFSVLATTPFQLMPNTLAAMRASCGSDAPYEILLPVWICQILTTVFAIAACKILAKVF